MTRVNFQGMGPHGNELYWTMQGDAATILKRCQTQAAELGVKTYGAPRHCSKPDDWEWVFDPDAAREREARAQREQERKEKLAIEGAAKREAKLEEASNAK